MKMSKKAQIFNQLAGLAIGVVVVAITLTVGFLIVSQAQEQIADIEGTTFAASNSSAKNATMELQSAMADIPGWVPLIIIGVIGSILLGLVALFRRK